MGKKRINQAGLPVKLGFQVLGWDIKCTTSEKKKEKEVVTTERDGIVTTPTAVWLGIKETPLVLSSFSLPLVSARFVSEILQRARLRS